MEKIKKAKVVKENLPSLQDCFSMNHQGRTLFFLHLDKAPQEFKDAYPGLLTDYKHQVMIAKFLDGVSANCQLNALTFYSTQGTLSVVLKMIFNLSNKKVADHVAREFFKFLAVSIKNTASLRSRPLLLFDMRQEVYKELSKFLNFTTCKVNQPYISSNNSNMRLILVSITEVQKPII